MNDDPIPIADALRAARQSVRPRLAEGYELDGDDLAEVKRRGMEELQAARWQGVIPARFLRAQLDDIEGAPGKEVREWSALVGPRPNLVLLGALGAGKSHAAVAACRADHDAGLEVRFVPVAEMLDLLRPGGPESVYWDLCDVDRLIIDDLGHERATDWTGERLGAVINRRWLEERPTVATSNLAPDALEEAVGARTYSRLVRSGAVVVRFAGDDRRREDG